MSKDKTKAEEKEIRINVALRTKEDKQAYYDLKGLAAMHGLGIQDVVIPALYEAVERLRDYEKRRILIPGKLMRLSLKRKRPEKQKEESK